MTCYFPNVFGVLGDVGTQLVATPGKIGTPNPTWNLSGCCCLTISIHAFIAKNYIKLFHLEFQEMCQLMYKSLLVATFNSSNGSGGAEDVSGAVQIRGDVRRNDSSVQGSLNYPFLRE